MLHAQSGSSVCITAKVATDDDTKSQSSETNPSEDGIAPAPKAKRAKVATRWNIPSDVLVGLKAAYEEWKWPSTTQRKHLAVRLGCEERQVAVWFQNRRQRRNEVKQAEGGGHHYCPAPDTPSYFWFNGDSCKCYPLDLDTGTGTTLKLSVAVSYNALYTSLAVWLPDQTCGGGLTDMSQSTVKPAMLVGPFYPGTCNALKDSISKFAVCGDANANCYVYMDVLSYGGPSTKVRCFYIS